MTKVSDRELLQDVFRAYFDARRNKRNTINQLSFEMDFEHNLFELASQIQQRTYKVGRSVCFIVNKPVKREIFAADFRDRVVHHLIYNYLGELMESKLIRDCYSCRKGYGTSDGIGRIEHHMRSVTDNFTRTAYVLKLDIRGYFMSINRQILYDKIERIVNSSGNRGDKHKDLELYLLREIIFNDPTEGCRRKCDPVEWEGLPPSKSLFHSPQGCGLPIGNLTSQMFSNLYLSDFDHWIKRELKIKHYGRYVDDFFVMHTDKEYLLYIKNEITRYLKENYSLAVHPDKIYLQDVRQGVVFLGAQIKPYRNYVRKKTFGTIRYGMRIADQKLAKFGKAVPDTQQLYCARSTVNSYFGYMGQFKTRGIRKKIWNESPGFKKYFSMNASVRKASVKPKYRPYVAESDGLGYFELFPEF